jgi:hypothetical protein
MKCWILIVGLWWVVAVGVYGQQAGEPRASFGEAVFVNFDYGMYLPMGKLSERFGWVSGIGTGVEHVNSRQWTYGVGGRFFFGSVVKEDVLDILRNEQGGIVGSNFEYAEIEVSMRGGDVALHGAKIIRLSKKNFSGIRLGVGSGYLLHKVYISDRSKSVYALEGNLVKGYDRFTGGVFVSEFIGYQHLSNDGLINLSVGLDMKQGLTKSLRGYNYNTQSYDTDWRTDILSGLKFTWTLPFFITESDRPDKQKEFIFD